ncbi:MAG: ATP-binding protein [Pirellulaceae bacterium]
MTRLFFRFYLGVILILFVAWLIQAYVFRGTTDAENIAVIESALGGGAISARDDFVRNGPDRHQETLADVRKRFDYPVHLVRRSGLGISVPMASRLDQGEAVLMGGNMVVLIPDSNQLVSLGPLPQFASPTRRVVLIGLGSVFLMAALAIAFLLRPIAKQLRSVEQTALAIAGGDLSARIVEGKQKRRLPIADAFNSMADRVETLLRSQKELLQAVSHELRTPLARIRFASELVRSTDDKKRREERLDAIDEATEKLDDLVGELLDYTRLDADAEIDDRETVVLGDLVDEAISQYQPLFPNVSFEFVACPTIKIYTLRKGLLRSIGNLVSNAGKYASGFVHIRIAAEQEHCLICVDDDGDGIDQADRERVFQPFQRLTTARQPGTGLGLALVRRICRRLGGEVTVGDSPLGGASFVIKLPMTDSSISQR